MGSDELEELDTGVSDSTIVDRSGIVVGGSMMLYTDLRYAICSGTLCDCRLVY